MLWADTKPADSGHADRSLRFTPSPRQALTAESTLILHGSFDCFALTLVLNESHVHCFGQNALNQERPLGRLPGFRCWEFQSLDVRIHAITLGANDNICDKDTFTSMFIRYI
jgi:hypothetical protein